MAHFQTGIKGNRGPATRLGTAKSGIYAFARGWNGGARIKMWGKDGEDYIRITVGPHSTVGPCGSLHSTIIVDGPIDKVIAWAFEHGQYRL